MNRDVVGIAQTGSGKTCAFVLPLLVYISKQGRITEETAAEGPLSVILAPSRELANQIYEEALTFCKFMNIRCYALVGGGGVASIEQQGFAVRQVISRAQKSPIYIAKETYLHKGCAVRQVISLAPKKKKRRHALYARDMLSSSRARIGDSLGR